MIITTSTLRVVRVLAQIKEEFTRIVLIGTLVEETTGEKCRFHITAVVKTMVMTVIKVLRDSKKLK